MSCQWRDSVVFVDVAEDELALASTLAPSRHRHATFLHLLHLLRFLLLQLLFLSDLHLLAVFVATTRLVTHLGVCQTPLTDIDPDKLPDQRPLASPSTYPVGRNQPPDSQNILRQFYHIFHTYRDLMTVSLNRAPGFVAET